MHGEEPYRRESIESLRSPQATVVTVLISDHGDLGGKKARLGDDWSFPNRHLLAGGSESLAGLSCLSVFMRQMVTMTQQKICRDKRRHCQKVLVCGDSLRMCSEVL